MWFDISTGVYLEVRKKIQGKQIIAQGYANYDIRGMGLEELQPGDMRKVLSGYPDEKG